MKKLKVYTWMSFRVECKTHSRQTKEVVAAKSGAAAARLAGEDNPRRLFNFQEGGSPSEETVALANPEVIFWRPLDDNTGGWHRNQQDDD